MNENTTRAFALFLAVMIASSTTEWLDLPWWVMPAVYGLLFVIALLVQKTGNRRL